MLAKVRDGSRQLRREIPAHALFAIWCRVASRLDLRVARLIGCRRSIRETGARSMRVVAGELRGRRLCSAPGRETRPTSERARAGLFDWLGPRVAGARVLDLFAGTGALGIEALSRGASDAVFVERSRGALRALRENLADAGARARARASSSATSARGLGARVLAGASASTSCLPIRPTRADWLARLLACNGLAELLESRCDRDRRALALRSPAGARGAAALRGSKRYGETAFDWYERRRPRRPSREGRNHERETRRGVSRRASIRSRTGTST